MNLGLTLSHIEDCLWHFKFSSPWTWRLLPSLTRSSVRYRGRPSKESACSTALDLPALASARPVEILGLLESFPCFTLAILVMSWGCCYRHTEFLGFCIWNSESNWFYCYGLILPCDLAFSTVWEESTVFIFRTQKWSSLLLCSFLCSEDVCSESIQTPRLMPAYLS